MQQVTVSVEHSWPMGHRLQRHDGDCQYIHGHTYRLEAFFTGGLEDNPRSPRNGMVADFKDLRASVRRCIFTLDHGLIFEETDPAVGACSPFAKLTVVPFPPTTERLAGWLRERIDTDVRNSDIGVRCLRLRLWESGSTYAEVEVVSGQ